ncbi:hypothetical protein IWW37_003844 [Coemansia sp. RSA 2050]|nr:hypothetical protein IWW37_003844 [Coemansia sp. RSA 2050]KAJ2731416.1 hypothetical protein IW152_004560 [Coemansia sp. BCRC 34962]
MFAFDDCESLRTVDTRASTDSRACLLSPKPMATSAVYCYRAESDIEDIMDLQARISIPMTSQRVELTPAKRRSMQIAEVVSAVSRMGALRYSNQDYHTGGRRAHDMERLMAGIDRLSIDKLAHEQRYLVQ